MKLLFATVILILSASSFAVGADYQYECTPTVSDPGNTFGDNLTVTVSGPKLTVFDQGSQTTGTGDINPKYRPEKANLGKVQYAGFEDLTSEELLTHFLVDKTMLKGNEKGEVKAQASGEGYAGGTFECTLN